MALTEAQKKKIEEEEKYRAELRNGKSDLEKKKSHPIKGCIFTLLVIFICLPLGIGVLIGIFTPSYNIPKAEQNDPKIERRTAFTASVNFSGTQFIITNFDDVDCIGSKMEVNNKYALEGYTLEAGKTYTVGAGEFVNSDGTRFNPFATKPNNFYIYCLGKNEISYTSWTGTF